MQIPQWDKEAERLHDAVKGAARDDVYIVRILARFTNKQRKKLLKAYKEQFNEVRKNGYALEAEFDVPRTVQLLSQHIEIGRFENTLVTVMNRHGLSLRTRKNLTFPKVSRG